MVKDGAHDGLEHRGVIREPERHDQVFIITVGDDECSLLYIPLLYLDQVSLVKKNADLNFSNVAEIKVSGKLNLVMTSFRPQ